MKVVVERSLAVLTVRTLEPPNRGCALCHHSLAVLEAVFHRAGGVVVSRCPDCAREMVDAVERVLGDALEGAS